MDAGYQDKNCDRHWYHKEGRSISSFAPKQTILWSSRKLGCCSRCDASFLISESRSNRRFPTVVIVALRCLGHGKANPTRVPHVFLKGRFLRDSIWESILGLIKGNAGSLDFSSHNMASGAPNHSHCWGLGLQAIYFCT